MSKMQIDEHSLQMTLFSLNRHGSSPNEATGEQAQFAPWKRDERGQQAFIKLSKDEEIALLSVGEHCVVDAETQQAMLKLVNSGWTVDGELNISFEGNPEPGIDPYLYQDPITVELGQSLLYLVDPQTGAPLLRALPKVRDEVAKESGLIPAGVRVRDNMGLETNSYTILLKNAPIASGEAYLDRFLAVGTHEQLSELEGWTTTEPAYRMKAKWIEPQFKDKAEQMGCLLLGPMQVMLTHIKQVMLNAGPELLGLQETHNMISRLKITHPVVVEEFLQNRASLRRLRRVLRSLLAENVAVSDLVTILECVGEGLDRHDDDNAIVADCRLELSRQICWSYLNSENELRALVLGDDWENLLSRSQPLSQEEQEALISALRQALQDGDTPPVVVTNPATRLKLRHITAPLIPNLAVLSAREIAPGIRFIPTGSVKLKKEPAPAPEPETDKRAALQPEAQQEPQDKETESGKGKGILTRLIGKSTK